MSIGEKLQTVAENEQRVYEAGAKSAYDAFWDTYQANGTRVNYSNAFAGAGWTDETFEPKYDIIFGAVSQNTFSGSKITDLKGILDSRGLVLDIGKCETISGLFMASSITNVGVLDLRSAMSLAGVLTQATKLRSVEELILTDDGSFPIISSAFTGVTSLVDIKITGCIGSSLNMSYCTSLSVESMKSVISALKNFTGTGDEHTKTLKFSSARWNALEADSTAPDGSTWKEYVKSTLCWNV